MGKIHTKKVVEGIEVSHPPAPTPSLYGQQNQPIKANELRIGNWLYYEHKGVMKAAQVKHGVELDYIKAGEIRAFPILIAADILEYSGFRRSVKHNFIYRKSVNEVDNECFYIYLIEIESKLTCRITYSNNDAVDIKKTIDYVHQLQNLYFAITGNELQSDF